MILCKIALNKLWTKRCAGNIMVAVNNRKLWIKGSLGLINLNYNKYSNENQKS